MRTKTETLGLALAGVCVPLLVVGVFMPLVAYDFHIKLFGESFEVLHRRHQMIGKGSFTDVLAGQKAYFAACMVILFGVLIPVTKAIFFVIWLSGALPHETSQLLLRTAQRMSKWAAVDACMEALIVGMMLKVNGLQAHHGVAFPCFVLYCILSSAAFLCLPSAVQGEEAQPNRFHLAVAGKMTTQRRRVFTLVMSLSVFLVLLGIGGGAHTVHLWVPREAIVRNLDKAMVNRAGALRNAVPENLRNRLEDQVASTAGAIDANVSLSGCIHRLLMSGHVYSVFGSVLLFLCVILLPIVYAVCNAIKALTITELTKEEQEKMVPSGETDEDVPWWPVIDSVRNFAHDLAMVDVMVVGILICHLIFYTEPDIKLEVLPGFYPLFMAAICWYVHNFFCRAAQASAFRGVPEPSAEPGEEPVPVQGGAF